MKIAIAANSENEQGEISMGAGRASFYLIFENGKLIEKWKNPFSKGGGGAGWSVAYKLAEKNVGKVVAGNFGGNMGHALKEKNVRFEERTGKVSEAVEKGK